MRFDDQLAGLGHLEAGQLLQGHHGSVVLDHQLLDQCGRRPTGAHCGELALHVLDRFLHFADGVEQGLFGHIVQRIDRRAGVTRIPSALDDRADALAAQNRLQPPG